jgi:hypothetical protein
MNKYFSVFILSIFLIGHTFAQNAGFFDNTDRFLKQYVKNGRVNYTSLKQNSALLDSLVTQIGQMNIVGISDTYKQAFYINAYNLLIVHSVLQKYPISSPQKIAGFFDEKKHKVAGGLYTLNELEFDLLFSKYKDLRFHFALNCGAISCPTLYAEAFNPKELNEQLNFNTKMVMDRDDYVRIDHANKQIHVSKIFEWYKEMFDVNGGSIRRFINHNRFDLLPNDYVIVFDDYDWALNDLKK